MRTKTCKSCGIEFVVGPRQGLRVYCHPECGIESKNCAECGRTFTPSRYRPQQRFCSMECTYAQLPERNRTEQRVNKPGGLTEAEKDKIRLSRLDSGERRTYRKLNGRHEHRAVAESVLGRPLTKAEVVHHEDADKRNNDPANLFVFPSQAWHARHHKLNHLGQPTCNCECIRLKEVMHNAYFSESTSDAASARPDA